MPSNTAQSRLPVLLCDLDGTLIDTIPLILRGFAHTLKELGFGTVSEEVISENLGTPLYDHLAQWFPGEQECENAVRVYREHVVAAHDEDVSAFPDVLHALEQCKEQGIRLGVVTSKSRAIAQRGLDLTGMGDMFEVFVAAGDTKRGKPYPDPLLSALGSMEMEPGQAAYLGDTAVDMQAAQAAGMRPLVAGWGVRGADRESFGVHTWLDQPGDILAAL